ncbi:MAG: DNA integrity scanning protein DisA nucleotide-binding domain protein [Ignavibacteriales bacterium]|nr:DNA integrity scanning protein DisA nucleotide-binding domain protein [Ignavibacteriales bacterium]
MTAIIEILESVGVSGFLDILFMSVVIYSILVWFKRTKAAFVVIGMFIIGGAYLIARQLDLALTISIFQGFFAIIIIAVLIIFQEEIKHFLEQIASHNIVMSLRGRRVRGNPQANVDAIVNAVGELAMSKSGALFVLRGKDPLIRHLAGGIDLGGELSEPLLTSIFNSESPTHDGAVIISGETVTMFSAYLPLSKNTEKLWKLGTRHAAALGLAELTDALCIVISEQRGTISVAHNGDIRKLRDTGELKDLLQQFYRETDPANVTSIWKDFFKRNYREKAIAGVVTILLWFFFVHESKVEFKTFLVPVKYDNVASEFIVQRVDPTEIEVTFSAPKRSFYFLNSNNLRVDVPLFDIHQGVVRKTITRSNIVCPEALSVENIQPTTVTFRIGAAGAASQ